MLPYKDSKLQGEMKDREIMLHLEITLCTVGTQQVKARTRMKERPAPYTYTQLTGRVPAQCKQSPGIDAQ